MTYFEMMASLIFFGSITTMLGVYMGASVVKEEMNKELLRYHHKMTVDLMKEFDKVVKEND